PVFVSPYTFNKLALRVGWIQNDKFLRYDSYTFSTNAPSGHLPALWRREVFGQAYYYLMWRFPQLGWVVWTVCWLWTGCWLLISFVLRLWDWSWYFITCTWGLWWGLLGVLLLVLAVGVNARFSFLFSRL
ncbi:MAG: GUN4 domain-containing protein, partial [Dolichospermum sp.]